MEAKAQISILIAELDVADTFEVDDQSHLHVGHANSGKGHYCIRLIGLKDPSIKRIELHRLIYDKLSSLLATSVHALKIEVI